MYKLSFLIIVALLSVGCASTSPKVAGVNSEALYKGDLVRLEFYLTPGSNNSWGGRFAKKLKVGLLDEHFDGSKDNIYKVEVRALTWSQECADIDTRIITAKVYGQLVYSIKTIRPNKKTIYQSKPLPFSKQLTTAGNCKKRFTDIVYKETKEELLTKLTTVFALSMSNAEGKDVKDELKEAIAQLNEVDTSGSATYMRYFGNAYVSAVNGVGKGLASTLGGTSPIGTYDSGVSYNSGNSNNAMEMARENQRAMDNAYADQALSDTGYAPSSSTSGGSGIYLTTEKYPRQNEPRGTTTTTSGGIDYVNIPEGVRIKPTCYVVNSAACPDDCVCPGDSSKTHKEIPISGGDAR